MALRNLHQLKLEAGLQILDLRARQPHRRPAETGMLGGEPDRGFLRRGLHAPEQVVAVVQLSRIGGRLGRMHRRHFGADGGKVADQLVDVGGGQIVAPQPWHAYCRMKAEF